MHATAEIGGQDGIFNLDTKEYITIKGGVSDLQRRGVFDQKRRAGLEQIKRDIDSILDREGIDNGQPAAKADNTDKDGIADLKARGVYEEGRRAELGNIKRDVDSILDREGIDKEDEYAEAGARDSPEDFGAWSYSEINLRASRSGWG